MVRPRSRRQGRSKCSQAQRLGAPDFLSLSLRTNLLPEAMKRAAALIAAMERAEMEIMSQCAVQERWR
jgi:hypothetical protein